MKKADKKIDKQVCQALTKVCEVAKLEIQGFVWLTHFVNYNQFPSSLSVICIFDTKVELEQVRQQTKDQMIVRLIKSELEQINIHFKDISHHVLFDTEEACEAEHNGKWSKRSLKIKETER